MTTDPTLRANLQKLIARLLREAPTIYPTTNGETEQTPAIECVVMFNNSQTVRGSLSTTPEGLLRLLSPGSDGSGPLLIEQFFDYDAVMAIALTRQITTEVRRVQVPRIING
jgi:hypothetical protein